jgi:hypothetical protein
VWRRISGTAETNGAVTTFRDGAGRRTGTAEHLPDGRTQFRDAQGRMTGTATVPTPPLCWAASLC